MAEHLPRVERILREAAEEGAFDGVPGSGRPIEDIAEHYEPGWWTVSRVLKNDDCPGPVTSGPTFRHQFPARWRVSQHPARWLERERTRQRALALVADVRRSLPRLLAGADGETARRVIEVLNDRLAEVNSTLEPSDAVPLLDVERILARRRDG